MSNTIKVVVVDCHDLFRETFVQILRIIGYTVIGAAKNETELMASLTPAALPDIAVIHYKTTQPETLNITRWVKQHYPAIKTIIITQYNHNIPFNEIKKIGVEGIIIKSTFSNDRIVAALREVYNGGYFYPASIVNAEA